MHNDPMRGARGLVKMTFPAGEETAADRDVYRKSPDRVMLRLDGPLWHGHCSVHASKMRLSSRWGDRAESWAEGASLQIPALPLPD